MTIWKVFRFLTTAVLAGFVAGKASADPTAIGIGAFSGSETVVDYGAVATGDPVDGAAFGGVLHSYSEGGNPSTDAVIGIGPGDTNSMTVALIDGDSEGVLNLTFAGTYTRMGFNFAVEYIGAVTGAVTIELFNGAVSSGSLSYDASPDPEFAGGFAGVEDVDGFTMAVITWTTTLDIELFAFDNLRYEGPVSTVPEPGVLTLLGVGVAAVLLGRRRFAAA